MKIIHLSQTTSTNDYIKSVGQTDKIIVVTTQYQTRGRGQSGAWISDQGQNLLFSLKIQPDGIPASQGFILSQANALALRDTLMAYLPDVSVKWPNDIYADEMKICGTLIENSLSGKNIHQCVIGTGININQVSFPPGLAAPATSLRLLTQRAIPVMQVLDDFLTHFQHYYTLVQDREWQTIRQQYHQSLYQRDVERLYADHDGRFLGTIQMVETDGHIIILDNQGRRRRYAFKEVRML